MNDEPTPQNRRGRLTTGIPMGSLETAAKKYGFIVKMGKATRVDPETLRELERDPT